MGFIDKMLGRAPVENKRADVAEKFVGRARPRRAEWAPQGVTLPPWAKIADRQHERASITIDVDTEAAYAYWMELLGFTELTQYNLEVAFQCIKLDLQAALATSEHDPRFAERHAAFHFNRAEKYAQTYFAEDGATRIAKYPVGKSAVKKGRDGKEIALAGADLASKGLEARDHYVRVRGALPM